MSERSFDAIPGNTHIHCCGCINSSGDRVLASHITNVAGRSYALCEQHLNIELPPVPTNSTRKAT